MVDYATHKYAPSTGLIRKFTGDVEADEIFKSNFDTHVALASMLP